VTEPVAAPPPPSPTQSSAFVRSLRFIGRHPIGLLQTLFALLVGIVVLQNLEPTSIDVLFWSMKSVPKLFLLLVSMLIGAATWEILRRLLRRPSAAP
jgi:uncharacterized integral membrane protein